MYLSIPIVGIMSDWFKCFHIYEDTGIFVEDKFFNRQIRKCKKCGNGTIN